MPSQKNHTCKKCGDSLKSRHTNTKYCRKCSYRKTIRAVDRHAKKKRYRHPYQAYHAYITAYLKESKLVIPTY